MTSRALKKKTTPLKKTYCYVAKNQKGENIKGEIKAISNAFAKAELRNQGLMVKRLRKKTKPLLSFLGKRIDATDITIFSRQLATMITSGIPLLQSLEIIANGQDNMKMASLINELKDSINAGKTLSASLSEHPKHFSQLFIHLIHAGEESGALETMLDNVATYQERTETLKGKIKKALYYPIAVIGVAFLVTAGLLIFVVPQFETLFKGFGADLPFATKCVVYLSEFFQTNGWLILLSIIGSTWAFIHAKEKSRKFSAFIDWCMLRIPVLGVVFKKAAIARFCRTLMITFAAGLPLVNALESASGATGNSLYEKASLMIRDKVTIGQTMKSAMNETKMFPNMVIQMIAIGEESGALDKMLLKVATFYEEEVNNTVDSLSSLLEPLIMVILGTLVGGLVIAMYMPIFKIGAAF